VSDALEGLAADWPALSALLDEALSLPVAEHAAWLQALPAVHARLRPTLQRLLAANGELDTRLFLANVPPLPLPPSGVQPGEPVSGMQVGPYRLLSRLGRGGMASVWLAERVDGVLRRQVALKMPHVAWQGALAERLVRERDILASLEHPHIARLYEAGMDAAGRPYFAMELVRGEALDDYCRARGLGVRARLELLLQVADAVGHAHTRLVVHRDLKPANILVTEDGQVRLLDFGIAKLLEGERTAETGLTREWGGALTPSYASPEQIRGEPLGTASDVYSLGVVAYELLAGSLPYRLKRGSAAELEEAIASVDVPLASSLAGTPDAARQLRGDLDAILQQSLRKDPSQRYHSMAAWADDVQRHLQGRPVRAHLDSRGYRAAKFLRRNWLGVGSASAVALAVLVGGGIATWQWAEARREAQRAQLFSGQQYGVRSLYVATLTALNALEPTALSQPGTVFRVLQEQLADHERQYRDRPDELLAMVYAVAVQLSYSGEHEAAMAVGSRYLQLLKARPHAEPTTALSAHLTLGRTLQHLGRLEECEAMLRAGIAWAPDATDDESERFRVTLANDLGWLLVILGRRPEAQEVLDAAQSVAQRKFPLERDRFAIVHRLAQLHLGFDDARALAFALQAHAGYVAAGNVAASDMLFSHWNVGMARLANGLTAEALSSFDQAHRIAHDLYGQADRDTVRYLGWRASALATLGRHDEARTLLRTGQTALSAIDSPAARAGLEMIRGRLLENEFMRGDPVAAEKLASPSFAGFLDRPDVPDADVYLAAEAGALVGLNRADEALQRLANARRSMPPGAQRRPPGFRLSLVEIEARRALAQTAAARAQAQALVQEMRTEGATNSALLRAAESAAKR
jgi:serine/threonine-protein kinase